MIPYLGTSGYRKCRLRQRQSLDRLLRAGLAGVKLLFLNLFPDLTQDLANIVRLLRRSFKFVGWCPYRSSSLLLTAYGFQKIYATFPKETFVSWVELVNVYYSRNEIATDRVIERQK